MNGNRSEIWNGVKGLPLIIALIVTGVPVGAEGQEQVWHVAYSNPDPRNDGVSLREAPSVHSRRIATCYAQGVTALIQNGKREQSGGLIWIPIRVEGWMPMRRLAGVAPYLVEEAPGAWRVRYIGKGRRTDDTIAIRQEVSASSILVADVYDGTIVYQRNKGGNGSYEWLRGQVTGWIALKSENGTPLLEQGPRRGSAAMDPLPAEPLPRGSAKLVARKFDAIPGSPHSLISEVYEEIVALSPTTRWPAVHSSHDVVLLPLKVKSARRTGDTGWEVTFLAFPNFESSPERVGLESETERAIPSHGIAFLRTLISKPDITDITLSGEGRQEEVLAILHPGMVYGGFFSEGRLQTLSVGEFYYPRLKSSRVSAPHFRKSDPMAFRFNATTLLGADTMIEVVPDSVIGADYTKYDRMARIGHPSDGTIQHISGLSELWSVQVHSDLHFQVVAPHTEGRGGAGILDLESMDIGSSYEEDLKALKTFNTLAPSPMGLPTEEGWFSLLESKLGSIPLCQRIAEAWH